MENLDNVIQALEYCLGSNEDCAKCYLNDYDGCRDQLNLDALDALKELDADNQRLREMWADTTKKLSILRTELAEERERSARWLRESEPVVHAHWEQYTDEDEDWGDLSYFKCSACGTVELTGRKRCPECGAHMDEEVADG